MKILVVNSGSSSIKYELFEMEQDRKLVSGLLERVGEATGEVTHRKFHGENSGQTHRQTLAITDHTRGFQEMVRLLLDKRWGAIQDRREIRAVGHRVVHGGEEIRQTVRVTEAVCEVIKRHIPLAPLHNPANLRGIEVARETFPEADQFAVFDTAFHQTIPSKAFLYAIPQEFYHQWGVRRYGFHGTSHAYVVQRAARLLGRPVDELNLITLHLGNGCSMAAVEKGRCVETSMGMTPLEGLVMGTRCGDIDPAIPFFLMKRLKVSVEEIETILNKKSGLKGLYGHQDMRELLEGQQRGDAGAIQALEVYTHRIRKYIGAYMAVLGRVDALVFTAGIGQNAHWIRQECLRGLDSLGILLDQEKNQTGSANEERDISATHARTRVLVVPTNEEWQIAWEVYRLLASDDVSF